MKEEYLHYLFQSKYLGNEFQTSDGEKLKVIDFGTLNKNAGPDFSNAKVLYDRKIWAGPIEFHLKSSDWFRHNHQNDENYNNVIAHFVLEHDREVKSGDYLLPTVEIKDKIDLGHHNKYLRLSESTNLIPCEKQLLDVADKIKKDQIQDSLVIRLTRKSDDILKLISSLNGNRSRAFVQILAKAFGSKVNQMPFERLIENLDLKILGKLNYEQFKIEALFFGLAGFLEDESTEAHVQNLQKEFFYQRKLYNLHSMNKEEWKFSSMRPFNFPTIRIAQMSSLLCRTGSFASLVKNEIDLERINDQLEITLSSFWETHFQFGIETKSKSFKLSKAFKESLLINSLIPFIFAIGRLEKDEKLQDKAMNFLQKFPTEKNKIISNWSKMGLKAKSASDSQGLIELKNEFCNRKKCLFCKIGIDILDK